MQLHYPHCSYYETFTVVLLALHYRKTVSSVSAVHSKDVPAEWRTDSSHPAAQQTVTDSQSAAWAGLTHFLHLQFTKEKNIAVPLPAPTPGRRFTSSKTTTLTLQQTDTKTRAGSAAAYSDSFSVHGCLWVCGPITHHTQWFLWSRFARTPPLW